MELLAERLLLVDQTRALDLASGEIVECVRVPVEAAAAGREWHALADRRLACWHSHLPAWLDVIDTAPREVLVVRQIAVAVPGTPTAMRRAAEAWLTDVGAGASLDGRLRLWFRGAEDARVRTRHRASSRPTGGRAAGIRLHPPETLDGLRAMLDGLDDETRVLAVHAERRSGLTTWLRLAAREVRRHGACPVAPRALARVPGAVPLLAGRTVVLLQDRAHDGEPDDGDMALTETMVRLWRAGARVALIVGALGPRWSGPRVHLADPPLSALADAICTWPVTTVARRRELLRRAGGRPGPFVSQWLYGHADEGLARFGDCQSRLPTAVGRGSARRAIVVREPRAIWRTTATVASDVRERPAVAALGDASRALDRGAADAAEAGFRRAIDALLAGGETRLASALAEALRGVGTAAWDRARLDAATIALSLAVAVADLHGLAEEGGRARCALARVRLWQGRPSAAARVLRPLVPGEGSASLVAGVRGDVFMALGDVAGAWREWSAAIGHASNPRALADALLGTGRLHGCAGDRRRAAALCREAAPAARRSRCRRAWIDVRLLWLASLPNDDRPETRATRDHLLRRLLRRDVPLLVRLCAHRLRERAGGRPSPDVARFVDRWGSDAIDGLGSTAAARKEDTHMVRDLQAILEICRDTDDGRTAMTQTCALVRTRLDAAAVSVHGTPADWPRLAHAGTDRCDVRSLVARVLDTGLAVTLHRTPSGIDAAVPIRFAGQLRGVVACRWTVDGRLDGREAEVLLAGAATALAPHVYALLDADTRDRRATADTLGLLGTSAAMAALRDRIRRVAAAPFHVLIEGESGSGKELVARALHAAGPRHLRRFCAVNCAALTDDLLEAELFGHARGAFTGAVGERAGLFEEADGGTLFLDEVGELSPRAQAKLLRVIQDGEVRRVGESFPRRVDARIVAATNRGLADEVAAARFRADLLYRLDVVRVLAGPLRERPDDVVVIARACWQDATARLGSRAQLHPATLAALAKYHWPGNVRELQNVIRALSVNASPRGLVAPAALPAAIAAAGTMPAITLDNARRSFEQRFVSAALARAGQRPTQAARDLGVSRQGLRKLILRLGIAEAPPGRAAKAESGGEGEVRD